MDKPTFDALVSEHDAWLRRTLSRLGIGPNDLEDVLQEVLRGVARGLPAFDPALAAVPEHALSGWLSAICERQARNHRRTRRRRAETPRETAELDTHDSGSPSPETHLLICERDARLHEALETLDPERRAVVVAYELLGTPMAEVAVLLRVPLNTAWNRLRLARADLRAALLRRPHLPRPADARDVPALDFG